MTFRTWCRSSCAVVMAAALMQPTIVLAQEAPGDVSIGPRSSALVQRYATDLAKEPRMSTADKIALLRKKVKYVFVLFQENRSFDFYFGTFPGAHGLFSQSASATPGFKQAIVNTDGSVGTVSPFLIPQTVKDVNGKTVPIYPADTASIDHSHAGILVSQDFVNKVSLNDRFALDEEGLTTNAAGAIVSKTTGLAPSSNPTLIQKQMGELALGHVDCDTAPYLWQWADRFALFDNFHMTVTSASTPNALSMIAGQSGLTQWALHPDESSANTGSPVVASTGGEPVVGDPGPFPGSNLDQSPIKPPYNPGDENPNKPTFNQTYASLPLSFMGKAIAKTVSTDQNPALDLADVQHDMQTIGAKGNAPTDWAWFQEGYDAEPTDTAAYPIHSSYIIHHDAPQYFGYIGDNPEVAQNHLFGLNDFYTAVNNGMLPKAGGVAYVRGGYSNNDGLFAVDPNAAVKAAFLGSDDHPGYADAQISEQLLADEVNAIAASPYWKDSAIIITYDETDGIYDHAATTTRVNDPEGNPLEPSSRIPTIVISPYGKAHAIISQNSEHSSIIKLIDDLFDLTPLADLPDEKRGAKIGKTLLGQDYVGPADDNVPGIGDMLAAFDNARLNGTTAPLPASYAEIQPGQHALPHYPLGGCYTLNIVPTDYTGGKLVDPAPADFNPRPSLTPGVPTSGTWTP
jgi:phospholipase C